MNSWFLRAHTCRDTIHLEQLILNLHEKDLTTVSHAGTGCRLPFVATSNIWCDLFGSSFCCVRPYTHYPQRFPDEEITRRTVGHFSAIQSVSKWPMQGYMNTIACIPVGCLSNQDRVSSGLPTTNGCLKGKRLKKVKSISDCLHVHVRNDEGHHCRLLRRSGAWRYSRSINHFHVEIMLKLIQRIYMKFCFVCSFV